MRMRNDSHFLFHAPPCQGQWRLPAEELRHAISVLRASPGDVLSVTDGRGAIYRAVLLDAGGCLQAQSRSDSDPQRPRIHLFAGVGDRDKFEELIALTAPFELARITPLICRHSQRPWWRSWEKQQPRMEKKAIVAIKQSHCPFAPAIDRPQPFGSAIQRVQSPAVYGDMEGTPIGEAGEALAHAREVCCVVGPPGGCAADEREQLHHKNATAVWLGRYRLRTELAASTLCAAIRTCVKA
jgi:16S rRNA (uracil1498-N3)-methyltransferase